MLTDEVFLAMKQVSSSEGKMFTEKAFSGISDVEEGAYIVRNGGVGRFVITSYSIHYTKLYESL